MNHDDPHTDLLILVGRMDGKLDILLTRSAEHEARLGSLEAWKNRVIGIAVAAGALSGGAASKLSALLLH